MNIAEATSLLAQREELKIKVENEIVQYLKWKEEGYGGFMHYTIWKVDGFHEDAQFSFSYSNSEETSWKSSSGVTNLLLNEPVELFVKDKTGYTDIECKVTLGAADEEISVEEEKKKTDAGEGEGEQQASEGKGQEQAIVPNAPSAVYRGRFQFENVPDEEELRDEIEAKTDGERLAGNVVFHIRISYDNFNASLRSRELELEQIDKEIDAAKAQIKASQKNLAAASATTAGGEANGAAAPAAKKPTKKTSKSSKEGGTSTKKKGTSRKSKGADETISEPPPLEPVEEEGETQAAAAPGKPITETLLEKGGELLALGINQRAVVLFGIAALGIFFYGDYASV